MPGKPEKSPARASNRWEGTHTYKKPETAKKKARTVAQLREEAAAKSKASREEAIRRRRGSIGGAELEELGTTNTRNNRSLSQRRGSTGGIPPNPVTGPSSKVAQNNSEANSDVEEEFFDADAMPGSGKKKRQESGTAPEPGPNRQGGVDPEMRALLMSIKTDINASTNAAIERVDRRIQANEDAIRKVGEETAQEMKELKAHVDNSGRGIEARLENKLAERDRRLEGRLDKLEQTASRRDTARTPPAKVVSQKREDAYNKCRRTLKLWPISGSDLEDAVRVFMKQKLNIDDHRIESIPLSVSPSSGKLARDKKEMLVVFEDKDDRDYVKSMGVNLAGQSNVGMALHVPGFLLDDLYALNSVGYNIKSTHKGVKRSVKFDDGNLGLYLDICINEQWKRIYPPEAKNALKNATAATNGTNRTLSADDLSNLIQGEPVAGLTAVVVPADDVSPNPEADTSPTDDSMQQD